MDNKHLFSVKIKVFRAILIIAVFTFFLTMLVNLINQRPLMNIVQPFIGIFVCAVMYFVSKVRRFQNSIKVIFMLFLTLIYLPIAWLTSPGSYSAMAFYGVLILFVILSLSFYWWEYAFSVVTVMEMILLLNYEPMKPEQYRLYVSQEARALDLSMNFVIVALILFVVIRIMNTYFDMEHKRIFELSVMDPLTGIYNRRYLSHIIETYDKQKDGDFALLMLDLTHFKRVNDQYGHQEGDLVLKEVGTILKQYCRKKDVPIRYGGDEFLVFLQDADLEIAKQVKERIYVSFMEYAKAYKEVDLSIGIGMAESKGHRIEEIIRLADDHLYKEKVHRST